VYNAVKEQLPEMAYMNNGLPTGTYPGSFSDRLASLFPPLRSCPSPRIFCYKLMRIALIEPRFRVEAREFGLFDRLRIRATPLPSYPNPCSMFSSLDSCRLGK